MILNIELLQTKFSDFMFNLPQVYIDNACYISVSYMRIDELKRFLREIKTGNFTVSNSEITTFFSELFSLLVNSFYHR